VTRTLETFGISEQKLGYFILHNAAANDTTVATLACTYSFNAAHRRLRYAPHTLNLVRQTIIFGLDKDAYNNDTNEHAIEAQYLQE
jgi:hypothetical protein